MYRLVTAVVLGLTLFIPAPASAEPQPASVVRVVDGDTVDVLLEAGQRERLRLIGMDTPELYDPRKPVQCFAREASARAHELLDGQQVTIEDDPSQDTRDRYRRLLAYLWLPDGSLFNLRMIAEGYAHEYTYYLPYRYQAEFKEAERQAREHGLGLWAPETCNGDTNQPADSSVPLLASPPEQVGCVFRLGFATLRELILASYGDVVGACRENERYNPVNGDSLQLTARGLMVWRKADNWTAYTDGATTWLNGPCGLQTRPNSGPFFSWEGRPGALCEPPPPPPCEYTSHPAAETRGGRRPGPYDPAIKGNISFNTGEKIYHVPGGAYYGTTIIREEYGERWFCTEAEARANGWRRSTQ